MSRNATVTIRRVSVMNEISWEPALQHVIGSRDAPCHTGAAWTPARAASIVGNTAGREAGDHGGAGAAARAARRPHGRSCCWRGGHWQTTTTFGQLTQLITAPGRGMLTADGLASLMRGMRPDLETTA